MADLQTTVVQDAFVYLFNQQGGLVNIDVGFGSDNCCIKLAEHLGQVQFLALGSSSRYVYPAGAAGASTSCNPSGGYTFSHYGFYRYSDFSHSTPPLPENYFQSNPPETSPSFP